MAQGKKSFVLYCDLIHTFEHLSDEERGKVFFWLLEYVNDRNPEPLKGLLQAVVEPVKQQLKRDLKKFEQRAERSRENGQKGGRPRKNQNPIEPEKTQQDNLKPEKPDSDNDNVTVSDNVNDNDILLEKETKRFSFKKELLKEGFEEELVSDWLGVRKLKKAKNSQTAFKGFMREIKKAESSEIKRNEILKIIVENSWSGFKATWLNNTGNYERIQKTSGNISRTAGTERKDF